MFENTNTPESLAKSSDVTLASMDKSIKPLLSCDQCKHTKKTENGIKKLKKNKHNIDQLDGSSSICEEKVKHFHIRALFVVKLLKAKSNNIGTQYIVLRMKEFKKFCARVKSGTSEHWQGAFLPGCASQSATCCSFSFITYVGQMRARSINLC